MSFFLAKHSSKKNTQKPSRTPSNNISFQYVTLPHLPTAILPSLPRARHMSWKEMTSYFTRNCTCLASKLSTHTSEVEKSVDREAMGIFCSGKYENGRVCSVFLLNMTNLLDLFVHPKKSKWRSIEVSFSQCNF